ncbi:MAG: IS5/IS1182 family transposase, partial [Congregibacter sp.]|nr:IS5/IS1182 family transposase [Congregibacter sp.]
GYHRRSISTAMYRIKKLLGGTLSFRNYNAQVREIYAMIRCSGSQSKSLRLAINADFGSH